MSKCGCRAQSQSKVRKINFCFGSCFSSRWSQWKSVIAFSLDWISELSTSHYAVCLSNRPGVAFYGSFTYLTSPIEVRTQKKPHFDFLMNCLAISRMLVRKGRQYTSTRAIGSLTVWNLLFRVVLIATRCFSVLGQKNIFFSNEWLKMSMSLDPCPISKYYRYFTRHISSYCSVYSPSP